MPDKPKKKPKHTKLALPTDKKRDTGKSHATTSDRLGRKVGSAATGSPAGVSAAPGAAAIKTGASGKPAHGDGHAKRTPTDPAPSDAAVAKAPPDVEPNAPPPGQEREAAANDSAASANPEANARISGAQQPAAPLDNTILLPRARPGVSKARQRKRRRRLGFLAFVLAVILLMLFYFSGLYLNAAMGLDDLYDTARIALTPGSGFPMDFAMTGFWESEELGAGGFAALGAKDMAVFSGTGTELRRIQHGYANPGLSASDTRVCVYSRGGRDYVIEGRGDTIVRKTTEQDILFAEMSKGGWLALVTSSRFRANLAIYNPLYGASPQLQWPIIDDKPVCAAFHPDNRTLALGCLSVKGGTLGTVIYVLRTDSDQVSVAIAAPGACVLSLAYISQNRLLAVFDTYAALYDMRGEEQARFDYNGRTLRSCDTYSGNTALVFGESNQEQLELVLLSNQMVPLFSAQAASNTTPHVLVAEEGVFLETGFEVLAYTEKGAPGGILSVDAKPYALVRAPEPVLLTATTALPLAGLLEKETVSSVTQPEQGQSDTPSAETSAPVSEIQPPEPPAEPPGEPSGDPPVTPQI